jgi:hypothetical protein
VAFGKLRWFWTTGRNSVAFGIWVIVVRNEIYEFHWPTECAVNTDFCCAGNALNYDIVSNTDLRVYQSPRAIVPFDESQGSAFWLCG